jgi:hypothetical protein
MPTSKSELWTVANFYKAYEDGALIKPRIQRKMRWNLQRHINFINFANKHRNGVMPFLVNQIVVNDMIKYIIFDGNNRSNAVVDFKQRPLEYKQELIPASFSAEIRTALRKVPLEVLIKSRYSLARFCREYKLTYTVKAEDDDAWDTMVEVLAAMDFNQITLPFSIFTNLTEEEMCEIYESINTEGVKLTRQELLASNTSNILFTSATLSSFEALREILNRDYYEVMNESEKLQIDTDSIKDSINLFELLVSFQIQLSHTYEFIPMPCAATKDGLDTIFKVYEAITGGFTASQVPPNINELLERIMRGCKWINKYLNKFYTNRIDYAGIDKFRKLSNNQCLQLLTYVCDAIEHSTPVKTVEDTLKRVMLYHIALTDIPKELKDTLTDLAIDAIRYEAGGTFMPNQLKKIRATHSLEYVPSDADIRRVLEYMVKSDIAPIPYDKKPRARRPLTKAKALALSAFSITHVPADLLDKPHNKDHVVPWSSKWSGELDIERLGNFVLIHEELNKKRGKKAITDRWIEENGLKYMEYPTESEYRLAITGDTVNNSAYNTMCETREKIYIDAIMKLLG